MKNLSFPTFSALLIFVYEFLLVSRNLNRVNPVTTRVSQSLRGKEGILPCLLIVLLLRRHLISPRPSLRSWSSRRVSSLRIYLAGCSRKTEEVDALIRSSILTTFSSSLSVTKLIATPSLPARAVRPTRCVYSSGSCGRSQFTTIATSGISSPRAATSVLTNTGTTEARKRPRELSRSRWVRREWSAVLRTPSV